MRHGELKLIIGDKNLSSWSLRPWVLLAWADIPFEEQMIFLDRPDSRANLAAHSPSGLVPCLVDDGFVVWDSLAICEYLAEKFPGRNLWPRDVRARARARSLAAEMHSGFSTLRAVWPMEFTRENAALRVRPDLNRDIARVLSLWCDARSEFGAAAQGEAAGPFLFGAFSIADAMFAPVVSRFRTYGPVTYDSATDEKLCTDYMAAIWALPAINAWAEGARDET